MPFRAISRAYYALVTISCLMVMCAALTFLFGALKLELGESSAAVGHLKPLFALRAGSFQLLHNTAPFSQLAMAVIFLFTISLGLLRFAESLLALISAALLTAYFQLMSGLSAPSVAGYMVTLALIYLCFLACYGVRRLNRQRREGKFFKSHMPTNLADYYQKNPKGMKAVSESRELTILFCDIKKFTSISETLDSDKLRTWLNAYFDTVSRVVHKHGGTVDKYMGDSVMAFWGAPWPSESHAADAMDAADAIKAKVAMLSENLQTDGLPAITIGIGISTGFANVGHMGSSHHMTYTAVGDPVNTANRLQRCTGYYDLPVVVSDKTVEQIPEYLFRELDTVHVKGRQRFVRLFEPVCPVADASPVLRKRLQLHRKAMQFFRRGMWKDALAVFEKLQQDDLSERGFYQRYIDRVQTIIRTKPDDVRAHIIDMTRQAG